MTATIELAELGNTFSATITTFDFACAPGNCKVSPTMSSAYEFEKDRIQPIPLPVVLEQR